VLLVARYVGRKIVLVCDNGRFHATKAVQQWLAEHRDRIEVFWLPPYSPSRNLIERLWGHIKRTILANVLYGNFLVLPVFLANPRYAMESLAKR
jgi:transposase